MMRSSTSRSSIAGRDARPPGTRPRRSTFGLVHVDLLRRESTWAIEAEAAADLSASFDGGTPWLVQLGAGSFEMIAATNDGSTLVTHIRVAAGALTVEPPVVFGLSTTDAGAADVTGDGHPT